MSRFNNLEFGEEFDGDLESRAERRPASQNAQFKDEHYYLSEAQMAFHSGRFEHALRSYSRVLEFNALSLEAWAGQVRMLIELKQFSQAKQWADQALERFPDEPELLAAKAVALARLGDLKAALAYSDASIDSGGAEQPYVWLARGDVQLAQHEKRAAFSFEKAFALAPGSWLIRWLAARVHYYYRKFALALKEIQEALQFDAAQG